MEQFRKPLHMADSQTVLEIFCLGEIILVFKYP